ncbi:MAG: DNA-3-methyladenine glycosylase 2 family protein [Bryobacterales bacterium]|nr:DNA-3-methyladenine glycosylase 2 family protein [Bryobacterales bacterium]
MDAGDHFSQREVIAVREPYAWDRALAYLSWRCTPGVEEIGEGVYRRRTGEGVVTVGYRAGELLVSCAAAAARASRMFDAGCDPAAVRRVLEQCPVLRPRVKKAPGLRIPGCWEPFELCVRVVLGQQVSVKAAHTLMGRVAARCGGVETGKVAAADLSGLGLTGGRVRSLRALAEAAAGGRLRLDGARWAETAAGLAAIPGVGAWTVEYLAVRLGRDADAFPATDLGLLRASGARNAAELLRMAERWRPFRAYAAMYLWAVTL